MIEWFENYYVIYALLGLCGGGLLIKLITNFVYIRLVRASGAMGSSRNKLIKQMKLKFETFYKLKIGVNNVDIFVDKYVYKYKICGLLLSTWENISGLMLILCLLIAPISSILGVIIGCGESIILYTFFAGVCTSALLIFVDILFNIPSKRKIIKINIKDYLENYLKVRLEQEAENPEAFLQYRAEMASSLEKGMSLRRIRKEEKRQEKERRERQKFLELEAKQREREQSKKDKIEKKQAEVLRKEEEKRRMDEERRLQEEVKAEEKRKAMEEKKEKERQRLLEKQREEEQARLAAEAKAAKKRQGNAKRIEEKEQQQLREKEEEELRKQEANQRVMQNVHIATDFSETAASKDGKKKADAKQTKIQQRNERLKEEIQAQRELRAKERVEGRDPFETYVGAKKVESPKNYRVNDFSMEHEMRVKAIQREEEKVKEVNTVEEGKLAEKAITATVQARKKEGIQIRGNSPSEDKVIDDILKEFLA